MRLTLVRNQKSEKCFKSVIFIGKLLTVYHKHPYRVLHTDQQENDVRMVGYRNQMFDTSQIRCMFGNTIVALQKISCF